MSRSPFRFRRLAAALLLGTFASLGLATPAAAQITVFDPTNYSQNLLSAARVLEQINQQIQSLQNEAAMLQNQARNLARIDFPQLEQITSRLRQIDALMDKAKGVDFRVGEVDQQFKALFPDAFAAARTGDARVADARARFDRAMAGYRQSMGVQAQVVENVAADAQLLAELSARSQGAEGALQVGQATNQLLALIAKQQIQLQQMMAAQFRGQTLEAATRAQSQAEGRAATKRFLGSGSAYTPER